MRLKFAFMRFLTGIFILAFLCEFLIYYLVLYQCSYPVLNPEFEDSSIITNGTVEELRAMILADTHLLGPYRGHWFDKLRREWQMYRSFQSAVAIHNPDIIFILGDIFDEGMWTTQTEFDAYLKRFANLFNVEKPIELFVVPGNHDIGFHYRMSPNLEHRFSTAFKSRPVSFVSRRNVHFVLINSMAMEGDGCSICQKAEKNLKTVAAKLRCTKGVGVCKGIKPLPSYSKPIILQHFPMYRESDESCQEIDSAPPVLKNEKFRERWECLSREASEMLIEMLRPRVILTGHTHHGCYRFYPESKIHEYTVPSFSWRNKNNPTFMLGVFTSNNHALERCPLPQETTVIALYVIGLFVNIFIYFLPRRRFSLHEHKNPKTYVWTIKRRPVQKSK
ncbi:metallophosphoesterase 1 [Bemisia tabaci]|uniref:metallophosphoesterase 1 n=1 Tax=Bemisia tabaci TaxID=7038 RepID=UPI0008F9CE96|nr:PREDICTED: metallophosphoesterase 1 [Bemisia tabaci]